MELDKRLMDFNGHQVIGFTAPSGPAKQAVSLKDSTKSELIALAEERGVDVGARPTKAKIIKALEKSDV
tara:strand:+ start:159 stop:365 length:207 start_codon:yes stop_codon:yes gene_type:complete